MLAEEQTEELEVETQTALKKIVQSRRERENARERCHDKVSANPPTHAELNRQAVFIDIDPCCLPPDWNAGGPCRYEALVTSDVHAASIFVSEHPWEPRNPLVTVMAVLRGAWIVTPAVYLLRSQGPAVKFKPATAIVRTVFVSAGFIQENKRLWLAMLELLNVVSHKWKVLTDPADYAVAKVRAKSNPSRVIALVALGELEAHPVLPHVFDLEKFLGFITIREEKRITLGLGAM